MAGTKAGGAKVKARMLELYGSDYYARIGRKGGQNGNTGGFAAGEEGRRRASYWGTIGGRNGRGTKKTRVKNANA